MIDFVYWLLFSVEPNAAWCDFGISAGLAASIIGAVGSVASAAISTFGQKQPKEIKPPNEANIAKGESDQRKRLLAARGYKSTILSDLTSQYGGMGMKQTLGA